MPRLIQTACQDAFELGDLVETLETGGFDPEDEEAMAAFAEPLRRLANNRRFLGDLVIEELKHHCSRQSARNHYSSQVIILHNTARDFVLRANFWPAAADTVMVNSGREPFFYGVPHDHNFSFLTAGYLGPGYLSDYYEYDYSRVVGIPGEKVDLRFMERSRLSPGKVLLYRRHLDVHSQLPPDSLSVSLNILAVSPGSEFCEQYSFDLERREVAGIINSSSLETMVRLAAHFGGGNGDDLVEWTARNHPSERMRFAAWRARASAAPDLEGRIAVYERAAAEPGAFVSQMAVREMRRLEETLPWFKARRDLVAEP